MNKNEYRASVIELDKKMTNTEVDIAIDNYLEQKGYQDWEELSQEDREKVLYEQYQLEQEYWRGVRADTHE